MLRVVGSPDGSSLQKFWSACRKDDGLMWNHPTLQDIDSLEDLRHIIPLANHGDGVPITSPGAKSASLHVMSINSLTGVGATLDTHFFF